MAKGTITYIEEDGSEETVPVTGGHCKLQWKPDFGMRWAALGVDYEMYRQGSSQPGAAVRRHLQDRRRHAAASSLVYELFLDDQGQKISKSKGNGITHRRMADLWLAGESLALFMFQKPRDRQAAVSST